jgi:DNA-binding response OmpR family regulator
MYKTNYYPYVLTARQTILIVEDDKDLRRLYRTALTIAGYQVRESPDAVDALRQIDADPPDLIVLDLGLPTFGGHVVQQEVAAQVQTRHIPILVVTGSDQKISNVACVLRKPISPDRLVEEVRRCVTAAAARRSAT